MLTCLWGIITLLYKAENDTLAINTWGNTHSHKQTEERSQRPGESNACASVERVAVGLDEQVGL